MPKRSIPSSECSPFASSSSIPETLFDGLPIPKLFAFDLDYTLWPFWVDAHVTPPFQQINKPDGTSVVRDRFGKEWCFYRDVPAILSLLCAHPSKPKIVAASRTPEAEFAREFLRKLLVPHPHPEHQKRLPQSDKPAQPPTPIPAYDLFHHMEIYTGSKLNHFKNIYKKFNGVSKSGKKGSPNKSETQCGELIAYEDMLFFDDERRNREVERELGVMMILIVDGTSASVIDDGIRTWRKKRGIIKREDGEEESEKEDDYDPDAAWYSD